MKRREFFLGATSIASMAYVDTVSAIPPCFPPLDNSGSPSGDCPLPTGGVTLSDDASQIGPGQWLNSIAMPSDVQTWDITWQNRTAFWDDTRRELQFMGKPQSSQGGRNRSPHWVYSESANQWRTTSSNVTPNSFGHIWCVTFDDTVNPGDYYHVQQQPSEGGNTRTLLRYNRATDSWGQLPQADFDVWNNSSTPNSGPVFHPNLLGPGRPGIYCFSNDALSYFDVTNQTWTLVRGSIFYDTPYGNWKQNSSLYVPGLDLAIFGSGQNGYSGGTPQCVIIQGGDGDNTSPPLRDMPVPVDNNNGNSGDSFNMLLDPSDQSQSTIMLLEANGNRVYTSNNPMAGLSGWTLQSYTHPFSDNNPFCNPDRNNHPQSWTCCSIPRYGVVLGLASYVNGGGTMMWRPRPVSL